MIQLPPPPPPPDPDSEQRLGSVFARLTVFQVQRRTAGWRAFFKQWGALVVLCALPLAFPCLSQAQTPMADSDGNGLIEIDSLLMLHNMRHNLAGTSYKASADSSGNDEGCPTEDGCTGYELTRNLDFDADKDGSTWSGSADEGYTLDSGDRNADYFPVQGGAGGWLPIGNETNPFVAVFDGNSYTISGLAIRRDQTYVGLFGRTGGAVIRNLGLIGNLADYTGSGNNAISIGDLYRDFFGGFVGGLVGLQVSGSITASYATGAADGGDGHFDFVGGLVGLQVSGSITASYATGAAAGGSGDFDNVGGLTGVQYDGSITASYATGAADGGGGDFDSVGGLAGSHGGSITASYATGNAMGGDGDGDSVGGLVGFQLGSITESHATGVASGGDGENDQVGGLVGTTHSSDSSITASYATGNATGGNGDDDYVGGLVGFQEESPITASYATGAADGGDGADDRVGGLVGALGFGGSITASYATGAADGGNGDDDYVGGLAGFQEDGLITASYATGAADGGDGDYDRVGVLVGYQEDGSITASYGFGRTVDGESGGLDGAYKPVSSAAELTAANAGSIWNDADNNTFGAWDFGTGTQIPALNYADYDGGGSDFGCGPNSGQFPANVCGTLLPGQADVSAGGPSAVGFGETVSLAGSLKFGRVTIASWSWQQLEGPEVTLSDANARETTFTAPATSVRLVFELTATDSEGRRYTDRASLAATVNDRDGNGLIEIDNLIMLHDMRHNLAGTSYRASAGSVGNSFGCPDTGCFGYELMQELDFDVDGDGSTWSGNIDEGGDEGYRLDAADSQAEYFPVDGAGAGGWLPIGDEANPFAAVFDGNGHSLRNLAIRRNLDDAGLFGVIGEGAAIRDLGLIENLADYTGSGDDSTNIGGLVGRQSGGSITASWATGAAAGGDGDSDNVGGLVGRQVSGSITASWATGTAAGGDGDFDGVGGLVGRQVSGSITASYATGTAAGGDGDFDSVGGLVGRQVGGSITASWATGAADGGDGDNDFVGALVGRQEGGSIMAGYGFGTTMGGEFSGSDGSTRPPEVGTAAQLTAAAAGPVWDDADSNTQGAWDFGTDSQIPSLNYADYDGAGAVFGCDPNQGQFPADACGARLPGQAREVKLIASGPSTVEPGETVRIAGSLEFGLVTTGPWSWRQLEGPNVTLSDASARETTFIAPATRGTLVFELTVTDSGGRRYTDRISLAVADKVDRDGDGLIDIDSLAMLHNMRHNLEGTSYRTGTASVGDSTGCPRTGCIGYELTRDLDFDADGDGDGSTWSGSSEEGYTLDLHDRQADYFPVDDAGVGGWLPIGDSSNSFVAVFDGNGHTISNLAIRRDQTRVGLFGRIGSGAAIRNLGLIDNLADNTGDYYGAGTGGLVGEQSGGSITASYATGNATGGDGDDNSVGGLVGEQNGGSITASYATGAATGGDGDYDQVGGLVGFQEEGGSITASYATGAATGGDGEDDCVGGLVGAQYGGSITASYATGAATGGDGDYDRVGGLVGCRGGPITASYGFGGVMDGEIKGQMAPPNLMESGPRLS